jgi:hypothetical protein
MSTSEPTRRESAEHDVNGYYAIEHEMQKRREQWRSVIGQDTPFRVEFRYRGGTKHWQYFASIEHANKAEDVCCSYSPLGRAIISRPLSQRVQVRGPRGGWRNT